MCCCDLCKRWANLILEVQAQQQIPQTLWGEITSSWGGGGGVVQKCFRSLRWSNKFQRVSDSRGLDVYLPVSSSSTRRGNSSLNCKTLHLPNTIPAHVYIGISGECSAHANEREQSSTYSWLSLQLGCTVVLQRTNSQTGGRIRMDWAHLLSLIVTDAHTILPRWRVSCLCLLLI